MRKISDVMLQPKLREERKCHLFRQFSTKAFVLPKVIGPGGYALLAVPVVTFCLGTWQVKRRKWKLNLIAELEEKTSEPPVDFPNDLNELSELEYRKVKVRGRFDHSKELFIGPRSLITPEKGHSSGSIFSSSPRSGSHVITPFQLSDRDLLILVNRGWVPRQKVSPEKRQEGQIEDEIELTGIVRRGEKRPTFCPKNEVKKNFYYFRDLDAMSERCGTEPILLDAVYESSVPGGPIGGQTMVTLRNEHLSYIVTWYSLCAVTLWLWCRKYILNKSL